MAAQPLGAILAGGRSRRFGSDKALAMIAGRTMLDLVAERLRPQCAALVVVGRDWPALMRVDDRPLPGLGPLGGLAGALDHAVRHGHDTVLTTGCDLPDLPDDLAGLLGAPDALLVDQPTVGWWRSALAAPLEDWLGGDRRWSIKAWAAEVGARAVVAPPIANVNRREDLAGFSLPADPRSSR